MARRSPRRVLVSIPFFGARVNTLPRRRVPMRPFTRRERDKRERAFAHGGGHNAAGAGICLSYGHMRTIRHLPQRAERRRGGAAAGTVRAERTGQAQAPTLRSARAHAAQGRHAHRAHGGGDSQPGDGGVRLLVGGVARTPADILHRIRQRAHIFLSGAQSGKVARGAGRHDRRQVQGAAGRQGLRDGTPPCSCRATS